MNRNLINKVLNFAIIKSNKISKKKLTLWVGVIIISLFSLLFISNNEGLYNKPIAKITSIDEQESYKKTDNGKIEPMKKQKIQAVIMNELYKGKTVELNNITSFSQV